MKNRKEKGKVEKKKKSEETIKNFWKSHKEIAENLDRMALFVVLCTGRY